MVQLLSLIRKIKNLFHLVSAFLANLWYGFPARKIKVIGVTGTDGKTTTVHLIYEILKKAGKRVSLISSVKAIVDGEECETGLHVTTPNPWFLQKIVRRVVERGGEYLVLEVTSHALDQERTWGIPFEIGVLTNVSHEHLDYHKSYEEYLATKIKLLRRAKVVVVNAEDRAYKKILNSKSQIPNKFQISNSKFKTKKMVGYGIRKGDLTSHNFKFKTPLPGDYNKLNCLAAVAVAKELGIKEEIIRKAISQFKGVVGRFEFIKTAQDFQVIIDFAHTPNALESLLRTLRPKVSGRIIHVFGAAGLRDREKRPLMGEISARYADIIILTEEDYRTEKVEKIMASIEKGISKEFKVQSSKFRGSSKSKVQNRIFKIANRQEAIEKAISLARKGDLVLLTGKGHEKSLCRGRREYPWSEHQAVKRALRALS